MASTTDDLTPCITRPFLDAVERFEELLNQSGRAFLIGAGCSKCAGLPLTAELTDNVLTHTELDTSTMAVLSAIQDGFSSSSDANIEDFLSELIDLLAIVSRRTERGVTPAGTEIGGTSYTAAQLRTAVDQIKTAIADVIDSQADIETHRNFVRALHRPVRQGRPRGGDRIDYLVLNYDTLLEDALALQQMPYADGIEGGATGWWNPATLERSDLTARVFKLHGSVDWRVFADDPLPRRISSKVSTSSSIQHNVLIWPATTKYLETQRDPFAQLAYMARRALTPTSDQQCVLTVCGYRFADSHINIELDRALRESNGELTIVAFTEDAQPEGMLKKWHDDATVSEHVLIFARRGFFHGSETTHSDADLHWWKFENITRLLGGER